ncbi:MAG: hypothetical protein M1826_001661 [Phylliscum demangeonii]|nr:MAG: hypothetical protein M1826_001661 [Phylliscum demangeonii]
MAELEETRDQVTINGLTSDAESTVRTDVLSRRVDAAAWQIKLRPLRPAGAPTIFWYRLVPNAVLAAGFRILPR